MLDALLKQAGVSEPGFARRSIKWAICCSSEGRYTGVVPLGSDAKGRLFERCPQLSQPELVGGATPRCHFLAEALPTVALFWKDDTEAKDQDKFRAKHQQFCDLLEQAATVAPDLAHAARLLSDPATLDSVRADLLRLKAKPTDTATVRISECWPLEQEDWHDWWRAYRLSLKTSKASAAARMRCLATGDWVEPAATHPKIKGLAGVGGLGTGDVLAGFDKAAFQSFGLEQSRNAAMSEATATAYAETLNRLIEEKNIRLGNTLAVYWYSGSVAIDNDPLDWLQTPPDAQQLAVNAEWRARQRLQAVREGVTVRADLSDSRYHLLLLSGASGRVMVRETLEGQFEQLLNAVDAWFSDFALIARDGKGCASPPKFAAVIGSLVRDIKDAPAQLWQSLWHAALTGAPLPFSALAQATLRARLDILNDRPPSHARMGLIKAFHLRQGDTAVQVTVNIEHPAPAYHCGRLLAVLAQLQWAALGDVGAGVVQRYYTAASQTPGLVIGRLIANAKNHLNKLSGGLAYWYEGQIAEVMSAIQDIPVTLTLKDQSLFALGYYQQLAALKHIKSAENISAPSSMPTTDSETPQ